MPNRERITRVCARIAVGAALAMAGLPATTPLQASASSFTVSLSASATSSTAGTPVSLTATTNQDLGGTYFIQITDQTDGGSLASCGGPGTSCSTNAVQYTTTSHTYVATVTTSNGTIQATSNTVTVSFSGSSSWTVTLTTSSSSALAGQNVTLTATTNLPVDGTGYSIEIADDTSRSYVFAGTCLQGASCSVNTTQNTTTAHQYTAFIAPYSDYQGGSYPPQNSQDSSNHVTVAWTAASDACNGAQVVPFDGYIDGTYLRVRALTTGSQTLVCYRAVSSATGDIGGDISISTSVPQVGVPSTDANYQACEAAGNPPLVNGVVLGQPLYLDAYTSTGAGWVCVHAGPVQERIIAPISATGLPSVAQAADPTGLPVPGPAAGPPGYPSTTCQGSGGAANTQVLDANLGGTQASLSVWPVSGSQVDVCARIAGVTTAGGLITLTIAPVPGLPSVVQLQPVIGTSGSVSPSCTTVIAQFSAPATILLSTSAPNQVNPAMVCLEAGSLVESVAVGVSGAVTPPGLPVVPLPTITLDPDTP